MLVATGANVQQASTPREVKYGDVVLDSEGKVWERQRDHNHGRFEWHAAAGPHRLYANRPEEAVSFPVWILAQES